MTNNIEQFGLTVTHPLTSQTNLLTQVLILSTSLIPLTLQDLPAPALSAYSNYQYFDSRPMISTVRPFEAAYRTIITDFARKILEGVEDTDRDIALARRKRFRSMYEKF